MFYRVPILCLAFVTCLLSVSGNTRTVDFAGRKADRVEDKRFDRKMWTQPERSTLQNKSFPIEEWNKHYSSLGSKRAPIAVNERREKERFETRMIDRESFPLEISRWNERMADLHKRAGIEVDDQAQIAANRQLYNMMMQDTRQYANLAEELSLRDINRFQFRSNRPDGQIPTQQAGSSE